LESDEPSRLLQDLQSVTDAALSYLPLDELLDELLTRVSEILVVDTVAILLVDEDRRTLVARAAKGLEEEVERGVRIPLGRGFAGVVAGEQRPIHIPDVEHADIFNPILREQGLRSLLGAPLLVEGEVIGVLHVGSRGDRRFTPDDTSLLQAAADRAALAIRARLSERQRGLAEELQRSLLPQTLPAFPGAIVAARYLPASAAPLGGDWYDAFLTRAGMLCMTIGDVVGRGFRAAAVMAQLRSALRAYALDERPPLELVSRLNRLIRQLEPDRSATLVYVVFDPRSRAVQMVTAGNPPPLIVSPAGDASFVQVPPSAPLGATARADYVVVESHLEPGSRLVLYTDGLIETPSEPLDAGLERLRQVASVEVEEVDAFCEYVFQSLLPTGPHEDDAALVAVDTPALGNPLVLTLPAERDSVPLFRRVLTRWLVDAGATQDETDALVLACAEACANAIEHAYPPDRRDFRVEARNDDGEISLLVRDWGTWRPPRGDNRGRGIMMMEALTDSVKIKHGADGTLVSIRHNLAEAA
jgi:anti-sigma regulatory factor (Ser/Thr protein kinase)/putative methionine-R-sulfoxide reductase with GAF domain